MRKRLLDLPLLLAITAILFSGESPSSARYDPDGPRPRIEGISPWELWNDSLHRRLLPGSSSNRWHSPDGGLEVSASVDGDDLPQVIGSVKGRVLTQGTVVLLRVGEKLRRAQQVFPGGRFGRDCYGRPFYSITLQPFNRRGPLSLSAEGDRQGVIRAIWLHVIPNHPSPNA